MIKLSKNGAGKTHRQIKNTLHSNVFKTVKKPFAKRLGRLKAGIRVEAIGRVKGPWLLVRTNGDIKGFVFEPILMPVIDGTLTKPIKGDIANDDGRSCDYTIEFFYLTFLQTIIDISR